jgi:hypothetical protein
VARPVGNWCVPIHFEFLPPRKHACIQQAQSATARYGKIASQYDADGVDLHFLNAILEDKGIKHTNLTVSLLRPSLIIRR